MRNFSKEVKIETHTMFFGQLRMGRIRPCDAGTKGAAKIFLRSSGRSTNDDIQFRRQPSSNTRAACGSKT